MGGGNFLLEENLTIEWEEEEKEKRGGGGGARDRK